MSDKVMYCIDFTYADNNQSFSTTALMTEEEAAEVSVRLDDYVEEGLMLWPMIYKRNDISQSKDDALGEIENALNY